ncbi:MAG: menaquinone biosynthesis decarboxylase [Mucinivorans sp.]
MYKNLQQFIKQLEKESLLVRIKVAVDPVLEIAELTDRESKSAGGGRALLFEKTGTDFAVLTNMMGSERRIALALGVEELDEVAQSIDQMVHELLSPKTTLWSKLAVLPMMRNVASYLPRLKSGRGQCQQVVMREPSLAALPILKCWPADGGRFITLPMVHTQEPKSGAQNVGMYRMQVFDETTTGMHWHRHKTGQAHYAQSQGRMAVAVCLGGDPVYTYAATAPLPQGVDEYILAGFLRKKAVRLVRCLTSDLRVPEDVDFVIEGYVDTTEPKSLEGPFGDHTGFYSLEDFYPLFHVTCITHRQGAIYPATIVGVPPQEDYYFARATERIFLSPIRAVVAPEVVDLWMPRAGVAHNLAVVVINKSYAGQAFKVASALWGAGQMSLNKVLVVIDPTQMDYMEYIMERLHYFDASADTIVVRGALDVLDHTCAEVGFGGKMCVDLTLKNGQEGGDHTALERIPLEVELDDIFESELSFEERLWVALGNVDPSRDITITGRRMYVDGRVKSLAARRWPNVVVSSPETIALVDGRWDEYGLGEFISSPSVRYQRLNLGSGASREG